MNKGKGRGVNHSDVFVHVNKNLTVNAIHVNLSQDCIVITEDKAFRCLCDWKSKLEHSKAWVAPISLFAPLLLTLVTASFHDTFHISKELWQALFLLGTLGSGIWTVAGFYRAFQSKDNQTVEALLDQLKKGAVIERSAIRTAEVSKQLTIPSPDHNAKP